MCDSMGNLLQQICIIGLLLALPSVSYAEANAPVNGQFNLNGQAIGYQVEVLLDDLAYPWSLAVIGKDDFLITEKVGKLRRYTQGHSHHIDLLPEVYVEGQGGLLEVLIDRDFHNNQRIYLSYASGTRDANQLVIASAILGIDRLNDLNVLHRVMPLKDTPVHFGGRMVQLPDGRLIVTTGDGFDYRESAQMLDSELGKTLQILTDKKQQYSAAFKEHSTLWTIGHRNPQGLVYDEVKDELLMHEHGPKGGDEINRLEAGVNYGWPVATRGKDYAGGLISPYEDYPGMQEPLLNWTPSIAPSGMAIYRGAEFPELEGYLLIGALVTRAIHLVKNESGVEEQGLMLETLKRRIRDIRIGPDGEILVLTDENPGALLKITRQENQEQPL